MANKNGASVASILSASLRDLYSGSDASEVTRKMMTGLGVDWDIISGMTLNEAGKLTPSPEERARALQLARQRSSNEEQ